jgi:hypothetical protein
MQLCTVCYGASDMCVMHGRAPPSVETMALQGAAGKSSVQQLGWCCVVLLLLLRFVVVVVGTTPRQATTLSQPRCLCCRSGGRAVTSPPAAVSSLKRPSWPRARSALRRESGTRKAARRSLCWRGLAAVRSRGTVRKIHTNRHAGKNHARPPITRTQTNCHAQSCNHGRHSSENTPPSPQQLITLRRTQCALTIW